MTTVKKQFITLSTVWFIFFFLSNYALGYPHWRVPTISIVNYYLYFMILLLAVTIALKEKHFPIVYIYISLMALAYLFGFFVMFTGRDYTFGDNNFVFKYWSYRKIAIHLAIFISVAHITICQIGRSCRKVTRLVISLALGFLVAFFFFRGLIYNPSQFVQEGIIDRLLSAGISMNGLSIGVIGIYSFSYYQRGKPFSRHINFLVVGFFFFLLVDINDNYYQLQQKETPAFSQFILLINLIYFVLVLGHKLYFMQSPYGGFWEALISGSKKTKYDIIVKISSIEKKLLDFTSHFQRSYRWVLSLILDAIAIALLILFFPYKYTARTLIAIIVFSIFLLAYLFYLSKKKSKNEFRIKKGEMKKK